MPPPALGHRGAAWRSGSRSRGRASGVSVRRRACPRERLARTPPACPACPGPAAGAQGLSCGCRAGQEAVGCVCPARRGWLCQVLEPECGLGVTERSVVTFPGRRSFCTCLSPPWGALLSPAVHRSACPCGACAPAVPRMPRVCVGQVSLRAAPGDHVPSGPRRPAAAPSSACRSTSSTARPCGAGSGRRRRTAC